VSQDCLVGTQNLGQAKAVVADEGVVFVFVKFSNLTSCPSALLRGILARPLGTNAVELTFNQVLGKEAVDGVRIRNSY